MRFEQQPPDPWAEENKAAEDQKKIQEAVDNSPGKNMPELSTEFTPWEEEEAAKKAAQEVPSEAIARQKKILKGVMLHLEKSKKDKLKEKE